MYLILLEDSTPVLKDAVTEEDLVACDDGYIQIFELKGCTTVLQYYQSWETLLILPKGTE